MFLDINNNIVINTIINIKIYNDCLFNTTPPFKACIKRKWAKLLYH